MPGGKRSRAPVVALGCSVKFHDTESPRSLGPESEGSLCISTREALYLLHCMEAEQVGRDRAGAFEVLRLPSPPSPKPQADTDPPAVVLMLGCSQEIFRLRRSFIRCLDREVPLSCAGKAIPRAP